MKIKILTGLYEGMTGETGVVDTDGGYPWVQVTVDLTKDVIWLKMDEFVEV